eukprot:g18289.t1
MWIQAINHNSKHRHNYDTPCRTGNVHISILYLASICGHIALTRACRSTSTPVQVARARSGRRAGSASLLRGFMLAARAWSVPARALQQLHFFLV